VDTVRFPRITLSNRTGDCDDTTALQGRSKIECDTQGKYARAS
jgi:hypothetical protein